ncbi:TolC family protein [Teredinibacter turnerae]|uniref:TolC family protein n=1 Tax=Teredinibacter turnerae TaxID=2426 RepID=UPI0018AD4AEA|nr:TolC family protein [Teredinibacter turnerae]
MTSRNSSQAFTRSLFNKKILPLIIVTMFSNQCLAELTEFKVLQLGMKNPQIQSQWQAQLEKARGQMQHAGRWENPSIEYSRENLDLPSGMSEENTLWLRQKINIAGVKGLERKAAESDYESQKSQQLLDIREWRRRLREDFYMTLAAQEKLALLTAVQSRLSTISDFVSQRAERGDASRFDALRIQKELTVMAGQFARAETFYLTERNQLLSKIELAPQEQEDLLSDTEYFSGRLLPDDSVIGELEDKKHWLDHPQILAINSSLQSAELSAKAAGREHWPEVTIGVGRKEVDDPGFSANGNTVALGITLPLFDHGRGEKRMAKSAIQELRARQTLLIRQLDANWLSATHALATHQKTALQLRTLSADSERSLSRLAEASYQAGELSVMELLDAYQSDLEANAQYIDTALEARLAYIQIQHLKGE